MNEPHVKYQGLSRQEAIDMDRRIKAELAEAYDLGVLSATCRCNCNESLDKKPDEL